MNSFDIMRRTLPIQNISLIYTMEMMYIWTRLLIYQFIVMTYRIAFAIMFLKKVWAISQLEMDDFLYFLAIMQEIRTFEYLSDDNHGR